jgi:two-component system alkaline phosphatase synthesis response regulator PhoP
MQNAKAKTILIGDDDFQYVNWLRATLEKEGYNVVWAQNVSEVMSKISTKPTAVIVDFMRGQSVGLDLCRELRNLPEFKHLPIIMLTRKREDSDEVTGLEVGADDYIHKSVSNRVLSARLRNVLKRSSSYSEPEFTEETTVEIKLGDLVVNRQMHTVLLKGKEVFLPRKEFELLWLLVANRGKVFSREILLRRIWGENVYVTDRTVDVHICKIRQRLGDFGQENLETIKGVGYRIKA